MRKTKLLFAIIGLCIVVTGSQASALTDKDGTVINLLFEKTKPQCIGRYVIDVPESFNNSLMNMIFIDDFRIESRSSYRPPFDQQLVRREQELHQAINKPGNTPENAPFIKQIVLLPDEMGVIFDHNENASDDSYRILEAHVFHNNVEFIITTNILDLSAPRYIKEKKDYLDAGFTEAQINNKHQKLAMMKSLISRLSGRHDEEIPCDKGLCIPNGFIKDNGKVYNQDVSFIYENDDLNFSINTINSKIGSSDTLLNRSSQINDVIKLADLHTIKKGSLSHNGIPMQQWLVTGTQESNRIKEYFPSYNFVLYGNESISSYTMPWINIELHNSGKKTQYTESQMVDIWDRLVGSLRYRPGAF